ncbi:hypothetical protein [Sphingopyxis witflariensis]|nr:hypothetical protein [Sphingopyxis witflariensis]
MTDDQKEELAILKRKLAARKDNPGWAKSAKAIEDRIAELENDAD